MQLHNLPNRQHNLPAKKPDNPDVPDESSEFLNLNDDILSSLLSPKSQRNSERGFRRQFMRTSGSQASTPKMRGGLKLTLPTRARNFDEFERVSSLKLPYGEPKVQMAARVGPYNKAGSNMFENWANDLGSKLENLFKPLGLSPSNARVQPGLFNQSMYDSSKNMQIARPPPMLNVRLESRSVDSGSNHK